MEQCVIVGSGCAGLTAGIYAARADMKPIIIVGLGPGGQLMLTSDVENYPGFAQPVQGPDLMETMRHQCERLGVRFINDAISSVNFESRTLRVICADGIKLEAQTVIIATGAGARWLDLPSETKLRGKGVSACATCDGFFFKDKDLVVVGGGDTAMEEATFLTRFATKVMVVHRRNSLRASPAMEQKARNNPKISFIWDSVIDEVLGGESVAGVKIRNLKTGKSNDQSCHGLFVAIGHNPATGFLKGHLELDESGYIKTREGSWVLTSVPGVFAAGDCVDRRYRQAITAAGFGCMAAMEARWYLEENQNSREEKSE